MTTPIGAAAGYPGNAPPRPGMVRIPGGTFHMGSDAFYPEERPVREVTVGDFWIDRHPVTNQQFLRFVAATGYVTVAERAPDPGQYPGAPTEQLRAGSLVFAPTTGPVDLANAANWWTWTPGANWRHPEGPHSDLTGLADHPVVHMALEDVTAYCTWAGTALPTEAQWEFAARGGLDQAIFIWGDEERPAGRFMANTWQGHFPWRNTREDGFALTSPVGAFPGNDYGLLDMAGNVWEWTSDWFAIDNRSLSQQGDRHPHHLRSHIRDPGANPLHASFRIPRKVIKGGSHLCAPSYSFRYRPAARLPQAIDTAMSHIGFRCVLVRPDPENRGALT